MTDLRRCSVCKVPGHNRQTCRLADRGSPAVPRVPPDLDLDSLVGRLLRARGYAGLATRLDLVTDPAEWSEALYSLSELTDCEALLIVAALAYRDPSHLGRLRKLCEAQAEDDLLVDKPQSALILQAMAQVSPAL